MAKKAYEGMLAYEAGKREGRIEIICQIYEDYLPTVMNMLALISETSKEDSTIELANDTYNYINTILFKDLPEIYDNEYLNKVKKEIVLPEVE